MKQTKATTLQALEGQEYKLIAVHWKDKNGTPVFVKIRELSDLQIQAIGNFSLLGHSNIAPVSDWREIAKISAMQSNIVKAALVSPSYDELCQLAELGSFSKDVEEKYKEVSKDILTLPVGPERSELEKQLASIRMLFDMILPNVFVSEICEWELGINRTNINLVTDEIILNAAILQYNAKSGRISDYIDDKTLSPFNKRDIDQRGMVLFAEEVEKQKARKGTK